jgi:phosphate transport system protein
VDIRPQYRKALDALRQDTRRMGSLVDEALGRSLEALADRDTALAEAVIRGDEGIDLAEKAIEDACTVLIAREQPLAGDLRFVVTVLKVVTELERMGDHAAHVAKAARRTDAAVLPAALEGLAAMGTAARGMLRDVLAGFVAGDDEAVRGAAARDVEVDGLHAAVVRTVLDEPARGPAMLARAMATLFVARYLERAGDHVTNIAEWIVYERTGRHVELNP